MWVSDHVHAVHHRRASRSPFSGSAANSGVTAKIAANTKPQLPSATVMTQFEAVQLVP